MGLRAEKVEETRPRLTNMWKPVLLLVRKERSISREERQQVERISRNRRGGKETQLFERVEKK